jgi:hypothetical protein
MTSEPADDDDSSWHPKRLANRGLPRPKACKKEFDRLVKAAWSARWWAERRSDNYVICYPPPDAPPPAPGKPDFVVVPCTPSKQGTLNRVTRAFRKRGLDV